ncbi:MAG: hypothetical protein RLZZ258_656 [Actinomycetota bacterium]|jgi:hypothetical protein
MKKLFWFAVGAAAGLAAAKQIQENPKVAAVVDDYAKKAREFGAAMSEGFTERSSELAAERKAPAKEASTKSASKPTAK